MMGAAGKLPAGVVEFVAASGATSHSTVINTNKFLTLGAAPQAGDLILVHTTMGGGVTSPGYTQIGGNHTNGDGYVNRCYRKVADGSEGTTINYSGTDAVAAVFRGAAFKAVGSWSSVSGSANLTATPHGSTGSADAVVIFAINRDMGSNAAAGFTKVGPGVSSIFFSVNGFYVLSGGSTSGVTVTRGGSTTYSFTGIAITLQAA